MKYCRLIDWRKLQHYKDRAPVWFKTYTRDRTELGNPWLLLTDAQRGQLATLRMLAADLGNCIPYDPEFIAEEIQATEPVDLEALSAFLSVHRNKKACMEAEHLEMSGASPVKERASKSASKSASKPASKNASGSASNIASTEGEEEEDQNQREIKKRKEGGSSVKTSTKERPKPAAGIPPKSPDFSKPSPETERMLSQIAEERGLDLEKSAEVAGVPWPIEGPPAYVGDMVTKLKASMKEEPTLSKAQVVRMRHRMDLDARWETITPNLYDPAFVSSELLSLRKADPKAAEALLSRLSRWTELQVGAPLAGATSPLDGPTLGLWDIVADLPAAYERLGLGGRKQSKEAAAHA